MFCRNCAEVMLDTDITCPKCGFAAGTGMKYCATCGSASAPGAVICEICGNPVGNMMGGGAAYQTAPQFQQQGMPQGGMQYQQPAMQQPNMQFQQPGAMQMRSDPNMGAYGQQQNAYGAPNAYQQAPNANAYYQGVTYKSKLTAGLLGIFLGALGVHNFYLGYTGKAVVQLLLSLCSCGALAVVSEIWGIVEGIMILSGSINKDGKGLPLKD